MIHLFIEAKQLANNIFTPDKDTFHHLVRVQRLKPGQILQAVIPNQSISTLKITAILKDSLEYQLIQQQPLPTPACPSLALAQALPKQDKLTEIFKANTELGINEFWPIITQRVISLPNKEKAEAKLSRWHLIVKEAAKQAQRLNIPLINPSLILKDFLKTPAIQNYDLKLVLWEEENQQQLKEILTQYPAAKNILILIGPEGGLSTEEIAELKNHQFITASLGKNILRTEHAGFCTAAMILHHYK
jgi:16S rRNA (uracil1498-N3)-methyltransferase